MSDTLAGILPENEYVLEPRVCKRHGLNLRDGQRNCDQCNREANRKYWDSVRKLQANFGWSPPKERVEKKKRPHGRGYVYFIQADVGNEIKIGFSKTPMKRLRQLQTAAHRDLHLLAIMDGDMNLEHVIHARFAQYRTVGEWFKPAPEILDLCRRHATMDGSLQLAI